MTAHVNRYDSIDSFSWMTTPFTRTADGFLSGRAIVTNIGVFTYKQADGSTVRELRLPEEVFDFASLESMKLKPITDGHPDELVTPDNAGTLQVGTLGSDVTTTTQNRNYEGQPRSKNGQFATGKMQKNESKMQKTQTTVTVGSGGQAKALRDTLKTTLKSQLGVYTNVNTKIDAHLSGNSVRKMSSDKAVEKSKANGFTIYDHFEAASRIAKLYVNAKLVSVQPDKNSSENLLSIKRFSSLFSLNSGKDALAYITVKEATQQGHKIYSIELMQPQKNSGLDKSDRKGGGAGTQSPTSTLFYLIPPKSQASMTEINFGAKYPISCQDQAHN